MFSAKLIYLNILQPVACAKINIFFVLF